jgi:response regulator RpfG family c-di-GMP phosphodiesterase
MSQKILLVDDDPYVLRGYARRLQDQFELDTAQGGQEGLAAVEATGPYAVVVADMRMPEMDGVQLLSRIKEVAPDTVRIMLTGNADMQTAIEAVNKGNIFRFLTKPCPSDVFDEALRAGIKQYQLVTAERELLEDTLNGSIKVLIEVLSLASPPAFGRSNRMTRLVGQMTDQLQLAEGWQFKLAAMLSQIGCISLPPGVLEKINAQTPLNPDEQKMYNVHPSLACQLLAKIPRLRLIAKMIERQHQPAAQPVKPDDLTTNANFVLIGGQLLKAAFDLDELLIHGHTYDDALAIMHRRSNTYNPHLLAALGNSANIDVSALEQAGGGSLAVNSSELKTGMLIKQDVWSTNGILLVQKGQEVTLPVLMRLRNFAQGIGIEEPIIVSMPKSS